MAQPTPSLYALDPALPVLLRPDGAVQLGWSPRRAVLIQPPRGVTAVGLATLLRAMHSPVSISELQRHSDLSAGELDDLLAQLVTAGVATRGARQRPTRSASIRVHAAARCQSCWPKGCGVRRQDQAEQPAARRGDLPTPTGGVVDNLVADPACSATCTSGRRTYRGAGARRHRPGRSAGRPGVTSCRMRRLRWYRDAAWPAVARSCATRSGRRPREPAGHGGLRSARSIA